MRKSSSPYALREHGVRPPLARPAASWALQPLFLACVIGLALALALGCASQSSVAPSVTTADLIRAEADGSLAALYDRLEVDLVSPTLKPENRAQLEALQRQAGEKLAGQLAEDVRSSLASSELRIGDSINKQVIEEQRTRVAEMQTWSISIHQATLDDLDAETRRTSAAIAEREARFAALDVADVAGRTELLDEIVALEAPDSPEASTLIERRANLLIDLNQEVAAAIEAENYDEARRLLETVREIDPEDTGTAAKLATVDTKVFERDFWRALEQGDPDAAYALLTSIAATESFDLIRPNLEGSADVMAEYYVSLGAEATKAGDVPEAWRRFGESRGIQQLFGDTQARPPSEEAAFNKLLMKEYENAREHDQLGLAWGYLNVVHFMQGDSPALRRQLRESREQVLQRAIKRLSVSSFEAPQNANTEFGDAIASGIVQHLFEAIPNDVGMIERDQLEDIMRERTIEGRRDADGATSLAAADFLVQGTILEAKVDTIDKRGKKTMRVVTEQVESANPAHNSWQNLSSKQRKNTPEPPRTILKPRKEDVTIEVTVHRKVGIFSVSYRVIDAASAKVVYADSVRAKVQHDDTSTEGVELGDFKLEFKLASLPSDIEILAELADQVSSEIGAKLALVLADPEMTYRENAERFAREANFEGAAQQYAYAIVLAQRKDQATDDLESALRESCIATAGR